MCCYSAGYWNLANSDNDWSPPDDLDDFMQKAERDGKPLVYIASLTDATLAITPTDLSHLYRGSDPLPYLIPTW